MKNFSEWLIEEKHDAAAHASLHSYHEPLNSIGFKHTNSSHGDKPTGKSKAAEGRLTHHTYEHPTHGSVRVSHPYGVSSTVSKVSYHPTKGQGKDFGLYWSGHGVPKAGAFKNYLSKRLTENFSDDEIKTANKTSRAAGAVSGKAIVPRYVEHSEKRDHPGETGKRKILDFGAGHKAVHTAALRAKGHDVTAHEFGANRVKGVHDPDALKKKHHKAYASNVLNVQSGHKMMHNTLSQVRGALHKDGEFVANYPDSPRKSTLSHEDVEKHLKNHFHNVKRVKSVPNEGGKDSKVNNKAPLFHCSHPKEDHEVKHNVSESTKSGFERANEHRASPAFKAIVKKHGIKPYYEMGDTKTIDHHVPASKKDAVSKDLIDAGIPHNMGHYYYGHRLTIKGE